MSQCIKCVARLRQSYRAPCRVRATHWLSPLWQPSSRRFRRSMGSPRPRAPPIPRRHHFPCGQGPWSTCSLNGPSTDWLQATCIWMLLQWTRTRRADGFVGEVWQLMRRSQELRRAQDINPGSSDRSNRAWHKGAGGPGTSRPGGATRFLIGPVSPSRRLRVRSMPRSIALPRSGSTDDAAPLGPRCPTAMDNADRCWAPSKGYNPHGRSRDDAWGFFGFRFCAFVCHSAAFC
jgi:hypothetical protein